MSMKVKVFPMAEPRTLESLINEWLEKNPNIHVEHVTQSQVQHGQAMSMPITIYIWYTE